jgi:hypothetical protein
MKGVVVMLAPLLVLFLMFSVVIMFVLNYLLLIMIFIVEPVLLEITPRDYLIKAIIKPIIKLAKIISSDQC